MIRITITITIAIALLGACSKSGAPSAAAGSGAPSTPAATHGGCDPMRADFQALVAAPLTEVSGAPVGACNAYISKGQAGFVLAALIYTDGAPRPFEPTGPGAHTISGVGDQAYWTPASPGSHGPRLEAMKGKVRCELESPEPPKSSLKSTSDADQAAYAQLMGKVCNDMFAAQ